MVEYVGARWLKCDFHLHTPASECFKDKTVTPEMWVQACLDQHLDCVAVTDHNTNGWIDAVKVAAQETPLTVFPGVELTCDSSKVHLLVLFDINKTGQDVYDFLIRCGIKHEDFASTNAHCQMPCLEVIDIASEDGALVIPAHIDEFNGLGHISKKSIKDFFLREEILAAQIVNPEFRDSTIAINDEFARDYNIKYRRAEGVVGLDQIKGYHTCVQEAVQKGVALVSFSDNPDSEDPSKHGLAGIGKRYTWLKMDKQPSLEGIRQALMIPERVKNCFDSIGIPYKEPPLWIKAIEVSGTVLNKANDVFRVEFNPQLNTIIGGRGSGKSSVFRFLRGAFKKMNDIKSLQEIKEEQEKFFQKPDDERGVLKDETEVKVEFVRDSILHRVDYSFKNGIKIYRHDNNDWTEVPDKGYIEFFSFEQFTQKQVFAVAKNTNALRELIDSGSEEIDQLKRDKEETVRDYARVYKKLKTANSYQPRIDVLDTEIRDLKQKIDNLKSSNISSIAQTQEHFTMLHDRIEQYYGLMQSKLTQLLNSSKESAFPAFDDEGFDTLYKDEINSLLGPIKVFSSDIATQIGQSAEELLAQIQQSYEKMQGTQFEKDRVAHNDIYEAKKSELQKQGIEDIDNYQAYTEKLKLKEDERRFLMDITAQIPSLSQELTDIKNSLFNRHEEISQRRQQIVDALSTSKVKIEIKRSSDWKKFESQFREIIQKDKGYDGSFAIIRTLCFPQKPVSFEQIYQTILDDIHEIREGKESGLGFDGWFARMVRDLDDEQMARIETLIPDDQIDVLYKPNGSGNFRSIVSASAGQKTTAVLTYILSQGSIPLLLDQPEDDLDNRLVCDLVVDKIKQIKEKRQVIVITHNANIPVIGDAEYIVSMDSSSRYLKIHTKGMLESPDVKKEICAIMEGGEDAFKLRALRYKTIL